MRRSTLLFFIPLLLLCATSVAAQRYPQPRPAPPPYRPPVSIPRTGSPVNRPPVAPVNRPPKFPARTPSTSSSNPGQRTTANRATTAGGASFKAPIPPAKSPQITFARTQANAKLSQLRNILSIRRNRVAAGGGGSKPPGSGGGSGRGAEPPKRVAANDNRPPSGILTRNRAQILEGLRPVPKKQGWIEAQRNMIGGDQAARDIFRQVAGREPSGQKDTYIGKNKRITYRTATNSKSNMPKIEINHHDLKIYEKISFEP